MADTHDHYTLDVDTRDAISRFVGLGYLVGDVLSSWASTGGFNPKAMDELAMTVLDRTLELDRLLHKRG